MARTSQQTSERIWDVIRSVTVVLIAGVYRKRSAKSIEETVKSRPLGQQAMLSTAVLGALLGLSVFAASFGWIGLLAFWLSVIVLVN